MFKMDTRIFSDFFRHI